MAEKRGGVGEVFEVNGLGEKEIGFVVNGVYEHLGVDLLELFYGNAFFQKR